MTLIHGGQLHQVAYQYQIPVDDWLDLSTGIAPISYPIPDIPLVLWQNLPQKSTGLIEAAKAYYLGGPVKALQYQNINRPQSINQSRQHVTQKPLTQKKATQQNPAQQATQQLVVTNGSQSIIKALPTLWRQHNQESHQVYVPVRGYKEHGQAWGKAGYDLNLYADELPALNELTSHCVLVIINPNNPTGKVFSRDVLVQYQQKIKALAGLLVIDEAFIDVIESHHTGEAQAEVFSLATNVTDDHLLVLRSFGKFFGLAGIRLGFLVANEHWHNIFTDYLGPWQVNGPAQLIAEKALNDNEWQANQKKELNSLRLKQTEALWQILGSEVIAELCATDLFITISFHQKDNAALLYHALCQQGVYVRLADERDTLRFGITLAEDLPRLILALHKAKKARVREHSCFDC